MPDESTLNFDWADFAAKLPVGTDAASREARARAFDACDANGNGVLSLAEFDRGLLEILSSDYQNQVFHAKPAIMRAFQAAKAASKRKQASGSAPMGRFGALSDDDYIDRSEFRLLIAYLREYFELWLMFELIDGGHAIGDRRITIKEFNAALPQMRKWGLSPDADVDFGKIDRDNSGVLRFDEFADWALRNRLDLETDDDVEISFTIPIDNFCSADREAVKATRQHMALMEKRGARPTTPPIEDDGRPLAKIVADMDVLRGEIAEIKSQSASRMASQPGSRVPSRPGSRMPSRPGSRVPSVPPSRVPSLPGSKVPSRCASPRPQQPQPPATPTTKTFKMAGLHTTWDVDEDPLQRAERRLGANAAIYKKRMLVEMDAARSTFALVAPKPPPTAAARGPASEFLPKLPASRRPLTSAAKPGWNSTAASAHVMLRAHITPTHAAERLLKQLDTPWRSPTQSDRIWSHNGRKTPFELQGKWHWPSQPKGHGKLAPIVAVHPSMLP